MRLTEEQVVKQLLESADKYKPLMFAGFEEGFPSSTKTRADAVGRISVENGPYIKVRIEIVSVATPKNISLKSKELRVDLGEFSESDLVPLIVAPFIGRKQAGILANEGISWIDLSGNMRVSVAGKMYIERTGNKNRFPDSAPIKKIFEGTSSLVSRALLLRPQGFSSQYELVDFINSRNANITSGTVSRVLKSLEDDLLITKERSLIFVRDARKLLQSLADGYINYARRRERKSYRFSIQERTSGSLRMNVNTSNYLACGFYAAQIKGLGATDEITVFARDMNLAREEFDFLEPDTEFGNFKFIETKDTDIWFNSVEKNLKIASVIEVSIPVVDDIQLYLEMMMDAPRGPKVAELLKERIVKTEYYGQ